MFQINPKKNSIFRQREHLFYKIAHLLRSKCVFNIILLTHNWPQSENFECAKVENFFDKIDLKIINRGNKIAIICPRIV